MGGGEGGGSGESVVLHIWPVVQDNSTLVPRNIFHQQTALLIP